ncbi:hypothetical protein [Phaeobacter inhibens]|uniref:hypothetical protein n=1 Tax=Phaeobacter inhibens TaxID=221822 RepID=UPI0021A607C6|nr:hypothetical protein [Phaeobacter inhibens]UWR88880.1 hypothetical protein K4L01_01740 [Phaeobacter inhibens]
MRGLFHKSIGIVVLIGLAACSQTYTTADGTSKTTKVPKAVLNYDKTKAAVEEGAVAFAEARAGSQYYKSISTVEATGFKNGLMSLVHIPINNEGAEKAITETLTGKDFASQAGKYSLHVNLDRATLNGGTVLDMSYSLRNQAGQEIAKFTEQSKFNVPFSAAPLGAVRGRIEFIGSFNNNLAQLTQQLR